VPNQVGQIVDDADDDYVDDILDDNERSQSYTDQPTSDQVAASPSQSTPGAIKAVKQGMPLASD